jgi:hypothetical protein
VVLFEFQLLGVFVKKVTADSGDNSNRKSHGHGLGSDSIWLVQWESFYSLFMCGNHLSSIELEKFITINRS